MNRRKGFLINTALYIAMILVFLIYFIPIFWIISTSFKAEKDAFDIPPKIVFKPTFVHYEDAFAKRGMITNFTNSVAIGISSSLLAMLLGTPAAYALSRYKFRNKEKLFFWFLSTRMAPAILAAIPFYVASRNLGFYDTKGLLIAVYMLINLSWVVWMMRSFFNEIPVEIDEASVVDGCNRFTAFVRNILPLSKPGLAATMVFCLILSWNEYFFALVLTGVNAKTLPAAITSFLTVHGLLWGQMCAAGTVIMLPILIFVMFMQKQLVRGLTMGAVKG